MSERFTTNIGFLVKIGYTITHCKKIEGKEMFLELISLGIGYEGEIVLFDFFEMCQNEYPKGSSTENEYYEQLEYLARDILESIDEGFIIIRKTIMEYDN